MVTQKTRQPCFLCRSVIYFLTIFQVESLPCVNTPKNRVEVWHEGLVLYEDAPAQVAT